MSTENWNQTLRKIADNAKWMEGSPNNVIYPSSDPRSVTAVEEEPNPENEHRQTLRVETVMEQQTISAASRDVFQSDIERSWARTCPWLFSPLDESLTDCRKHRRPEPGSKDLKGGCNTYRSILLFALASRALAAVRLVSAAHRRPVAHPDQASVPAGRASDYHHLVGRLGLNYRSS